MDHESRWYSMFKRLVQNKNHPTTLSSVSNMKSPPGPAADSHGGTPHQHEEQPHQGEGGGLRGRGSCWFSRAVRGP